MLLLQSCSSQKLNSSEQIIEWINERQTDSLRAYLDTAFSFELRDAARDKSKTAEFFLGDYIEAQKFVNGKYKIIKSEYESGTEDGRKVDFYVVHVSYKDVWQDYLDVGPLETRIKMEFNQGKLIFMSTGYADKKENEAWQAAFNKFVGWMRKNHPEERIAELMRNRDELLSKRMQEYKKQN